MNSCNLLHPQYRLHSKLYNCSWKTFLTCVFPNPWLSRDSPNNFHLRFQLSAPCRNTASQSWGQASSGCWGGEQTLTLHRDLEIYPEIAYLKETIQTTPDRTLNLNRKAPNLMRLRYSSLAEP
jgi:hypothetical protein